MYQTGGTIEKILEQIQVHDLVLPAIQREFVWRPLQIYRLFDSLMQGFPFGTFLFWQVARENSDKFNFYGFVRDYHERNNRHCPALAPIRNRRLTAVLDGQQRLTALNVGLCGSMAWKLPRKHWNNPNAFPTRHLYLDLLWEVAGDDEGMKYRFMFRRRSGPSHDGRKYWFRVRDVLSMKDGPAMSRWLGERIKEPHRADYAYGTLDRLYSVVHKDHIVAYYEETRQTLDDVVQIFIRMNDGGTPLSHSDLLLSIAVAQWTQYDAREEIHSLVDSLNRIEPGFSFSKDLVLKAGLMLSDIGSVGFKVDNFNRENMAILENQWRSIKASITLTVRLLASFGFSRTTLTAQNAILPIAYYLHRTLRRESFLNHSQFEEDRQAIRGWLIRSLLKRGVWGSGLDTLLSALRRVIRESGIESFPLLGLHKNEKTELTFKGEEIEDLADMEYRNPRTFALLSLIFPFVHPGYQFHVDHIFPASRFTTRRLRNACVPERDIDDFRQKVNRLANLQLLLGPVNNEKRAAMPAKWLARYYPEEEKKTAYLREHLMGPVPESMTEFANFYKDRREKLKAQILKLIGT